MKRSRARHGGPADDAAGAAESERLDKWLWHSRVVRTRTAAQELVARGAVRVNRVKTQQPSRPVRIGDVLTIRAAGRVLVWRVLALAERRGGSEAARELYEDLSAPPPAATPGPTD